MAIMAGRRRPRTSGKEQGSETPRCCFKVERFPIYRKTKAILGGSCQFADEFPDSSHLIEIAGHWFCPYHLPFSEADFAAVTKTDERLSEADKAKLKSA